MKKSHLIISGFVLIFLLFFGPVNILKAQTVQTKSYSLTDCIDLAIKNSYQLQTDSLLSKTIQMQVNQEQASYYPQISGALGFSGLFLSPYTFGQHYLQAIADWDLGKFWYKTSAIKQKQIERQEAIKQQNQLEITGVITGLYLDVQQNDFELQILNSRLEYLYRHLDILSVLWKAGTINQLDILQTQSTVNKVKEAVLQKEVEGSEAKYAMARLMGFDSDSGFDLTKINGFETPPANPFDGEEVYLQNYPQLITIQKEYETELLRKREVKASLLPHVQAFSGYTFDGDPTGDGSFVMLGLGATIPIYQWKKNDYRLQEIDITSEAIQTKKQNVERELSIRYGQIVKQIQQYKRILDFQQEKIANDEKTAQVAEINYKAGLSTNLDFLIAQQTLTETKMQINTVRNRYLKSIAAFYLLTNQTEKIKNIK
ncbi:MAG: TolC family protein [Draconibacterium sp.]|nr:TolC family protein [Draconibacterium sp.]